MWRINTHKNFKLLISNFKFRFIYLFPCAYLCYIYSVKKTVIFLSIFSSLLLSGCTLPFSQTVFSGLQVTAIPKATVYIDEKEMGKTPYLDEKVQSGEHSIRIVTDSSTYVSYQTKIKFTPKIMVAVNRVLGPTEILSAGEIITMEELSDPKVAELAVISNPDGAKVVIDTADVGITPFAQKNTSIGKHEVTIGLPGYTQRIINIITKAGYRLIINVQLAQILSQIPTLENLTATQSATTGATPILNQDMVYRTDKVLKPRVKILSSETGWLNVRSSPAISGTVLTKVYPQEYYPYLDEQSGWVKIGYEKDKEGWVSVKYVEKEF